MLKLSSGAPVGEMTVHNLHCQQREHKIDLTGFSGAGKAFVCPYINAAKKSS